MSNRIRQPEIHVIGMSLRAVAIIGLAMNNMIIPCHAADVTPADAVAALDKAVDFFQRNVSRHGGYLWCYSGDLTLREAEGKTGPDTIWVQPPGTPAVGEAFLDAYEATGGQRHLEAAQAAGDALLLGQLHSGGWHYRVEFDPQERSRFSYRCDTERRPTPDPVTPEDRQGGQGWHVWRKRAYKGNVTLLDDDTAQAALRFLMRLDRTLDFKDERLHEAVMYGLASLQNAQYPNGAWSHNYDRFPDHRPQNRHYPIVKASYPASWPTTWPKAFAGCYMLNDAITPRAIATLLVAWEIYDDDRFLRPAIRGGEFLLLAQMPEPQPAWAQQYDPNMHPVWDRAFEPAAISGRESQTVLETLLLLYRRTGDQRFLDPVPRALAYLRRSALPDGRLARFYELKTNRPIYFTRDADGRHQPTYRAERLATNYQFIVDSRLDAIEAQYRRLTDDSASQPSHYPSRRQTESARELANRAARIIEGMDARGAWVERGRLEHHRLAPESGIIRCQTFIDNVAALCEFMRKGAEQDVP